MIKVDCYACGKELDMPGGILLSPPSPAGTVSKLHFCIHCWFDISQCIETFKVNETWLNYRARKTKIVKGRKLLRRENE